MVTSSSESRSPEERAAQPRDITINIRAQQHQRDLIDQAASIQGKSRSEFMLESAYQKAQDVLLDRCFFSLDAKAYQQFLDLLDTPPQPNPALKKLLTTKAPWESATSNRQSS